MSEHDRTLRLLFPQWQGGNNPSYGFGARMLDWLAPSAAGPVEEVSVATSDGTPLVAEDGVIGRAAVLAQARDARARIDRHRPDRIVVLGGDCGVDLAPFAYLNERYDGDLAVLWVDAHSDLMTKAVFPGSHAHVLGTLLGEGDAEFVATVGRPLRYGHAFIAGLRELPEALSPLRDAEAGAMRRRGVGSAGPEALAEGSGPVLEWLRGTGARHVAVHFDLDVLDPSLFRSLTFSRPGDGASGPDDIPAGRMTLAQVVRLLRDVAGEVEVVGLGITEHMPWDAMALRDALAVMPLIGGTSAPS